MAGVINTDTVNTDQTQNIQPNQPVQNQPQTQAPVAPQPVQPNQNQPNQLPNQNNQMQPPPKTAPKIDYTNHPLNQKMGLLRKITETLAGGPRVTYTRDINTGEMKETPHHLSKGEIGMGIVAAALMGALGGAGKRGPAAGAEAFGAGGQAVMNQRQQMDEQKRKQADQDFTNNYFAVKSNMELLSNSIDLGQKVREQNENSIQNFKDAGLDPEELLKNPDTAGAVIAPDISSKDAMDVKQYPMTLIRIPIKAVDRFDENGSAVWQMPNGKIVPEGTVGGFAATDRRIAIIDPNFKVPINDENGNTKDLFKKAASDDYKLVSKDVLKAATGQTLPISKVSSIINSIDSVETFKHDLQNFSNSLGTGKDGKPIYPVPEIKLNGPNDSLIHAIQQYKRAAQYGNEPQTRIDAMRAEKQQLGTKSKITDSDLGLINKMFGATQHPEGSSLNMLETYNEAKKAEIEQKQSFAKKVGENEAGKAPVTSVRSDADAKAVKSDPNASQELKAIADAWFRMDIDLAGAKKQKELDVEASTPLGRQKLINEKLNAAKTKEEIAANASVNTGVSGPLYQGVDYAYINSLAKGGKGVDGTDIPADPGMAADIQSLVQGRSKQSPRNLSAKYGARFASAMNQAAPNIDLQQVEAYQKLRDGFTDGKDANSIMVGKNILEHLDLLTKNTTWSATTPIWKQLSNVVGGDAAVYNTAGEYLTHELAKLSSGDNAPDKETINQYRDIIGAYSKLSAETREKTIAKLVGTQIENRAQKWNQVPSSWVAPMEFISPKANEIYEKLTGQKLDLPKNTSQIPSGAYRILDPNDPTKTKDYSYDVYKQLIHDHPDIVTIGRN